MILKLVDAVTIESPVMHRHKQLIFRIKETLRCFTWNPVKWLTNRVQCYSIRDAWEMSLGLLAVHLTLLELEGISDPTAPES